MSLASNNPPPGPFFTFRPRSGEVNSLRYIKISESEAGVASGSSSGNIHLWSLTSKRSIWCESIESSILSINTCCINEVTKVISQARNRRVMVWDYLTKEKLTSFDIMDPGFCKLTTFNKCSHQCSSFAVASSEYNKVNLYNLLSECIEMTFTTKQSKHKGTCLCVTSIYDDSTGMSYVLGGFEDGSIVLWDERNNKTELNFCQLFSDPVLCMTVDNLMRGAAGSPGKTLQLFNVSLEKGTLEKCSALELKNPGISDIDVRQDRKIFATGGWDGRIRVFTWRKVKPLAVINHHSNTINCVCFAGNSSLHVDNNLLICGSKDGIISLWKLY